MSVKQIMDERYQERVAAGMQACQVFIGPIGDAIGIDEYYIEPLVMAVINAADRREEELIIKAYEDWVAPDGSITCEIRPTPNNAMD